MSQGQSLSQLLPQIPVCHPLLLDNLEQCIHTASEIRTIPGRGRVVQIDRAAGGSLVPLYRLLEAELASGGDDGQAVLQVVVDEVADAVEDSVLRPDL